MSKQPLALSSFDFVGNVLIWNDFAITRSKGIEEPKNTSN